MATAERIPKVRYVTGNDSNSNGESSKSESNVELGHADPHITIDQAYEGIHSLFEYTSGGLKSNVARLLQQINAYIDSITNEEMNQPKKRALYEGSENVLRNLDEKRWMLKEGDRGQFDMYMRAIEKHIVKITAEEKEAYLQRIAALFGGKRRTRKQKRKRSLKRKSCKKN